MSKKIKVALLPMIWLLTSSCFQKEIPVSPHLTGEVKSASVDLGSDYENQVYFDLGSNEIVAQNNRLDWDLSVSRHGDSLWLQLNGSRAMMAASAKTDNFYKKLNPDTFSFHWDDPSGDPSRLAIGNILNTPDWKNKIYLINLGVDADASPLGYRKIKFEKWDGRFLEMRFAEPDNSNEKTVRIELSDTSYNATYLSLLQDGYIPTIGAEKTDWDLLFTRHLRIFLVDGDTIPYLVTGVLLNPWKTLAARDSLHVFEDISLDNIGDFNFTKALDVIGYDWKEYDFKTNQYSIVPGRQYVIRDSEGFYYKLRFTGYYDKNGRKGVPQFEFVQL